VPNPQGAVASSRRQVLQHRSEQPDHRRPGELLLKLTAAEPQHGQLTDAVPAARRFGEQGRFPQTRRTLDDQRAAAPGDHAVNESIEGRQLSLALQ